MNKSNTEPAIDRRIQRTKKLLSDSLVALIIEKGYDNVTIQDIIDKANVGRSTFYSHFENKEQLLLDGHDTFRKLLDSDTNRKKNQHASTLNFIYLYQHIEENYVLAKALLGKKGGEIITSHLTSIIAYNIKQQYKKQAGKTKQEQTMFKFIADAIAAAVINLLQSWLEDNMPFTPEEMAKRSNELILSVLGKNQN